jgi:NADH-ubiquinone oxidoreductase chain 1
MYTNRSFILFPIIPLFMISALAETNRAPFDLPEAESELVAGFFTEHSAICFVFFFLAEYTSIITISTLFGILFFGLSISLPLIIFIIWIRAVLPRLRFDQLLKLGWTEILVFTLAFLILLPSFMFTFDLIG